MTRAEPHPQRTSMRYRLPVLTYRISMAQNELSNKTYQSTESTDGTAFETSSHVIFSARILLLVSICRTQVQAPVFSNVVGVYSQTAAVLSSSN